MKNEKVLWESHPGRNYRSFIFIRDIIGGLLSSGAVYYILDAMGVSNKSVLIFGPLIMFALWLLLAAVNQISMLLITYTVTSDRIIIKRGWLNRKLTALPKENIIDSKVTQSIQERVINSGTIYLFTANDSSNDENSYIDRTPRIENIDAPFRLHNLISEVIDEDIEDYE